MPEGVSSIHTLYDVINLFSALQYTELQLMSEFLGVRDNGGGQKVWF